MKFGLLFFGSEAQRAAKWYELMFDAAHVADASHLSFIGIPERHFNPFGGMFPNPSLLAAALSRYTNKIQIRACSVVLPLQHVVRVAEDWAVVDNLSGGRAAICVGSGWNVNDFSLAPDQYSRRHEFTFEQINELRKIWRDGVWRGRNAQGIEVELAVHPRPIQANLPVWVTSSQSKETIIAAAKIGANILTHMENQNLEGLTERVRLYRERRAESGFDPATGVFTVMQHCFVSDDPEEVEVATSDLRDYLARAMDLELSSVSKGGEMSGHKQIGAVELAFAREEILDHAVERYCGGLALIGNHRICRQRIRLLEEIGVDEVACLVDFRKSSASVLKGVKAIGELAREFSEETKADTAGALLKAFLQNEREP